MQASPSNHSNLIAAIIVPLAIVALLVVGAFVFVRRRRRRHGPRLLRTDSTFSYKKPELEGTPGTKRFSSKPKPELDAKSLKTSKAWYRRHAVELAEKASTYHEKDIDPPTRNFELPALLERQEEAPAEHPIKQAVAMPTEEYRRTSTNEGADFMGRPRPKFAVTTGSTPQAQAAVDANELNKLKAQEREMTEYIEAHETLQKLRNEHIALQERIKAAEERAQRSRVSGAD